MEPAQPPDIWAFFTRIAEFCAGMVIAVSGFIFRRHIARIDALETKVSGMDSMKERISGMAHELERLGDSLDTDAKDVRNQIAQLQQSLERAHRDNTARMDLIVAGLQQRQNGAQR